MVWNDDKKMHDMILTLTDVCVMVKGAIDQILKLKYGNYLNYMCPNDILQIHKLGKLVS